MKAVMVIGRDAGLNVAGSGREQWCREACEEGCGD
jgi:hypothetical protein